MNDKRVFLIMCGLTGFLFLLLVGGVAGANFILQQKASELRAKRLDNRILEEQQLALVRANKDISQYEDLEKIANTIVPQDKDQARTTRELVKLANDNNISLTTIAFQTSTLGQVVPKAAAGSSDSTSGATKDECATKTTQLKRVDGIPGVCQMEVTLTSDVNKPVPYSSFINFLSALEKNRRTAHVSNITITPYSKDISQITFSLGLNVFIKP